MRGDQCNFGGMDDALLFVIPNGVAVRNLLSVGRRDAVGGRRIPRFARNDKMAAGSRTESVLNLS
jgi:hypothetical protein